MSPAPPFTPGQAVRIPRLNAAGIVVECRPNGKVKVQIGAIVMDCSAADLIAQSKKASGSKAKRAKKTPACESFSATSRPLKGLRSIDLHGLRVEEARSVLLDFFDQAIRDRIERVEIVHGRGTGALRELTHAMLEELGIAASYSVPSHNPGSTVVYLNQ